MTDSQKADLEFKGTPIESEYFPDIVYVIHTSGKGMSIIQTKDREQELIINFANCDNLANEIKGIKAVYDGLKRERIEKRIRVKKGDKRDV
jgi:hypothetical protein